MKQILLTIILSVLAAYAFAAAPVVSNVVATPGSGQVTITYNLVSTAACDVRLLVSNNGGTSYNFYPAAVSGDVGTSVSSGNGKVIIWQPNVDNMETGANYKVKVIARDNPVQDASHYESFILVEGGTFNNGVSDVTVSSFFMDKYELTQSDYQAVMGVNPAHSYGVGNDYPVYYVSWFKAIEYSNWRSLQEGLVPCYSYSTYGTNPATWPAGWNTTSANHNNVSCSWTANGYRLPTEAEWQFAARGGNQTHNYTYSGSNDINAVAWYSSNSGSTTQTVGTKTANELGIYDMSGNVYEWNWDIYGSYPSGSQTNPHGAVSGSSQVNRGGGWGAYAQYCTVSVRFPTGAAGSGGGIGLRVCRSSL